jgi:hypothetical protein
MDLYPTLLEAGVLNNDDTRRITQALHVFIRNTHGGSKRSDLFPFVEQIVTDLRSGRIAPHPYAFVHLFGIYKDCKRFDDGYALWQWLVDQDERFVSQAAYGAAIELMAYGGIMSLPDLEDLYADALKRFPGTFAEYHLSPDAIVPDRTQPTAIAGIPMILLQGILTARILARDWKKAYLALDTALRLYPTQVPSRYFELFMTERPVAEAYTAFLVACRAGVSMRPSHVTALLTKLRTTISASPSMSDRIMLVRAMANLLYAFIEAGGHLQSLHVGVFIRALELLLPEKAAGKDYEGEAAELRNIIVAAARDIVSGLIQAGMKPESHPFEALISLAGRLRVPGLLVTALQDIKTTGIDIGPIGLRSATTSAGLVADKDLIEQLWQRVVSAAENEGAQITFEDWITFTKACRRADHVDYFREQLLKLPHAINSSTEKYLLQQIDLEEDAPNSDFFDYRRPAELSTEIQTLQSQMKNVAAAIMSGQPLDFSQTPFYMHLDPEHPSLGLVDDLRTVYDELTTDPHQPPPLHPIDGPQAQTVLSPLGIPLGELRFLNWVTVLEMMVDAEEYELNFQTALDAAIKSGKPLKSAAQPLSLRKKEIARPCSRAEILLRVRSLRASNPADVPLYRKVASQIPQETFKPMASQADQDKWRMRKITKYEIPAHREQAIQRGLPYIAARTVKVKPSSRF